MTTPPAQRDVTAVTFEPGKYLRAIAAVLHNEVVPLLEPGYARSRLELSGAVLLRMIADLEVNDDDAYRTELMAALDGNSPDSEAIGNALAWVDCDAPDIGHFTPAMATALAGAFVRDDTARPDLAPVIHAVTRAEHLVRQRKETRIAELRREIEQVRTSGTELVISEHVLTQYLRARFPDRPEVRAARVRPVPGGRSKGTILFDLVNGDRNRELVIRKDFAKNFMGCSVSDEFPIIRAAWKAGVTVPEPLWLEEDETFIDGKFIVFERARGRAAGTMFEIDATPGLVRNYAREMAKLHQIDIGSGDIARSLDHAGADFAVRDMILESYAKHRCRSPGDLLLESAHIWMLKHLDCVQRAPVLVHGDAGFHNVLCDGDEMTALLDWELAHAGDPAEDLMKCKAAASQVIPWSEFMAIYFAAGGAPLTEERERFFTIWRMASFSLFAVDAREMFLSGEDPDLRLAAVGYNTFARLQDQLARELATAPV